MYIHFEFLEFLSVYLRRVEVLWSPILIAAGRRVLQYSPAHETRWYLHYSTSGTLFNLTWCNIWVGTLFICRIVVMILCNICSVPDYCDKQNDPIKIRDILLNGCIAVLGEVWFKWSSFLNTSRSAYNFKGYLHWNKSE